MRDGRSVLAFSLRAFDVDVDPLADFGDVGKGVDALLVDLFQPLTPSSWPTRATASPIEVIFRMAGPYTKSIPPSMRTDWPVM